MGRLDLDAPLRFIWLAEPADGSDRLLPSALVRVCAATSDTPEGGCEVELKGLEPGERHGLSGRELQVLTLLACGLTNPAIAARLSVSRRTAATHVERLMGKLAVSNRVAAAALALDHDLLALPLRGAGLHDLAPTAVVAVEAEARGEPSTRAVPRSRAVRRQPLVIGTVFASNDDSAWDGQQMRQGAQLAIAEINRRGGVGGRQLRHIAVGADVTRRDFVREAIEQLVNRDVDAIAVGYTFERHRLALAAQFEPAAGGCPLLHHSTSATAARLVSEEPDRFGHVFQVCSREDVYGAGFVRTLTELRDSETWSPASRRLLVLDSADPDLQTFPPTAMVAAERAGWSVTVDTMGPFDPDWSLSLDRIRDLDPTAVMVACFSAPQLAGFLRRFRRTSSEALVYALYSPSVPGFLEQTGPAAEGLLWATVTGLYSDSFGRDFTRRFREQHGSTPGLSSAGIHYDMVNMLAAAWSRCVRPHDFTEVVDQLRGGVHRGVNGSYHFGNVDQTGLVYPDDTPDASIAQAHLVYQVQNGVHRIIAPQQYASTRFRLPPWASSTRPND